MNKILLNLLGIAGILALGVLAYVGYSMLNIETQRARNEAMYQCALSSKYEVATANATVSYPVKDVYQNCLSEKGIK